MIINNKKVNKILGLYPIKRNQNNQSVSSKHTTRVTENQGHGIVALDPGIQIFKIVNIGRSKVIGSSKIKLDRYLNGARNIFVRSLGDSPALKKLTSSACIVNEKESV